MSPALARALRSCNLRPTRSISAAIWRPFSVCRGRRQRNFFSQRFGQLRSADYYTLTRLDLGNETRDRPVGPVSDRGFEQRRDDSERGRGFHRHRAWRNAGLHRLEAAAHEVAAPQADRVLTHGKRLCDAPAGPATQRQQHRTRSVGLAKIEVIDELSEVVMYFTLR
jgi:hypothetical protein